MSLLFVMSAGIAFAFWQYCSYKDKTFLFQDNMDMDRYMNCEKKYELVVDDEQKKVRQGIQNEHKNYKERPRWQEPPGYWNVD